MNLNLFSKMNYIIYAHLHYAHLHYAHLHYAHLHYANCNVTVSWGLPETLP